MIDGGSLGMILMYILLHSIKPSIGKSDTACASQYVEKKLQQQDCDIRPSLAFVDGYKSSDLFQPVHIKYFRNMFY